MNNEWIETRLEQMAREMMVIAKVLDCSVDLHVTKYTGGGLGGDLFKIGQSAIGYPFYDDKRVNFRGFVNDRRHYPQ